MYPNKPGKLYRTMNGAVKFHGTSMNNSLAGPNLLQILIRVLSRFCQNEFAVSADIEDMVLRVCVPDCHQSSLRLMARTHCKTLHTSKRAFRLGLKICKHVLTMHYKARPETLQVSTLKQPNLS